MRFRRRDPDRTLRNHRRAGSNMNGSGPVMNERFDHVTLDGGRPAAVRICGVFEIKDGQIKAWRDYFDQSGAGAA